MNAQIHPAAQQQSINEQLDLYHDAARNFAAARKHLADLKLELAKQRAMLDAIEAEVIVNGGHDTYVISGSNAEARKASLTYALSFHEDYQRAAAQARHLEHSIASTEAGGEDDSNIMRGARLAIEYATSQNYLLARA